VVSELRTASPWVRRCRDESGVVIVLVAAAIGALFVMVALVVDLAGARRDRDADQIAADAMALAGAQGMSGATNYGAAACQAAWSYLVVNLPSAQTAPAPSCTTFASSCVATTARQVQATVGPYRITITHPVPNTHSLLQGRAVSPLDGRPCERIGIRVQQDRANLLASSSVALDVTAVARFLPGVGEADAPLVLLADHDCGVLTVSGTSSLTVSTSTGAPGYIAIDSDGDECSNPSKVVLDVNGQGSITAGQIALWALADGDPTSAYSSGLLSPAPIASSAPVGRTGMDWRYNCSPSNACPTGDPAHIDDMIALWGGSGAPLPAPSFTRWTTSGRSCSPSGATVVPAGSWYIDCGSGGLSTNGSITFQGGDIVSDGPITATGAGGLRVNCADNNINDLIAPATCAADPAAPSILYLRSGDLVDNGDVELRETTVYLATGKVTFSGNRSLTWTAPNDPSFKFDDLLVWTTSTSEMKITGNTTMTIEGIVFAPNATMELSGSTGGQALASQIFAKRAKLTGGAQLLLAPREDRILEVGKGRAVLIR
jgi:Flp pilus assembly protein TadG